MKKLFLYIFLCLLLLIGTNLYIFLTSTPEPEAIEKAQAYAKSNGMRTDVIVLCDFSKHSGKPRFWVYDCVNNKVLIRSLCSHGNGAGNHAWKALVSNKVGSHCSCVGMFRIEGLHRMSSYNISSLRLKGLSNTNSNAEQRGILIHPGLSSTVFCWGLFPFYLPLTPESEGCFAINYKAFDALTEITGQSKCKILLYAYI